MPKFILLQPTSTDAGHYTGMVDVVWESVVEGEFINDKENSIYVRGEEFIRIGGCPKAFKGNYRHVWGCFELA